MSTVPASQLPTTLSHRGVRSLCSVQADISQTKRIVKNGHWWNFSRRYELTVLDVKILPGSADLKFELWNEGRLLNGENDKVEVKWDGKLAKPTGNPTPTGYSPQSDMGANLSSMDISSQRSVER